MTRQRRRIYWALGGIVAVLLVAAAAAGPIMSRVEQPDYKVTMSDGATEIRSYGPMIAAEAEVKGERKAAINQGFRLIAAYIFGANKPNARIAMKAPVQQQGAQKLYVGNSVCEHPDPDVRVAAVAALSQVSAALRQRLLVPLLNVRAALVDLDPLWE